MAEKQKEYKAILKLKADTRQLDKAQKKVDKLCDTLEKANSLYDELASEEIEIGITSYVQQCRHSEGKYCFRFLWEMICRNVDKVRQVLQEMLVS